MARRMTLEGAKVQVVAELLPYSGGLKRNIVQCLDDFGIPLKLSHTVVDIEGKERVSGVTIAQVDQNRRPIPGTEKHYNCDTLLLSCGLIPENELSAKLGIEISPVTAGPLVNESLETNVEGVFACGNVLHVHDLVDFVSQEAQAAGKHAAIYVRNGAIHPICEGMDIPIVAEEGVRYTVPKSIHPQRMEENHTIRFRVGDVYQNCYVSVYFNQKRVIHRKRPVIVPGEMEEVVLKQEELKAFPNLSQITVKIE